MTWKVLVPCIVSTCDGASSIIIRALILFPGLASPLLQQQQQQRRRLLLLLLLFLLLRVLQILLQLLAPSVASASISMTTELVQHTKRSRQSREEARSMESQEKRLRDVNVDRRLVCTSPSLPTSIPLSFVELVP